ncbi:hypothetical protein [Actinoplanes sp. NPDC051411]|uniref:hypothetical protein n=1 Tax=Actinoplanes sp. NPDC051411 TaxID=3155522 RepID=UPI0034265D10
MTRLERSYQRLMLAYPAAYRRRHAAEIVTTLVEMSPPSRQRPPVADAWHLVAAGLRQRFRLPSRRPLAWAGALMLTLVLGALGAAAGSLVAAQTGAGLPSRAGFSALSRLAADGTDRFEQRDSAPHTVPLWWSDADAPGWTPAQAQARLARAGWALTPVRPLTGGASYGPDGQPIPLTRTGFDGTRDGLHLRVSGNVTAGHALVDVSVWPADNGSRWPLTVAGAVLGLLAGWPLAATLAYRLRRVPPGQSRLAAALTGAALAAVAVPAAACYANLGLMVRAAGEGDPPVLVYRAFTAGPFETWGWTWMIAQLATAALLLGLSGAAVALADRARAGTVLDRGVAS